MVYRNRSTYRGDGRMSDNRVAWAKTVLGTAEVRQHLPGDPTEGEEFDNEGQIGPNVQLRIIRPGAGKPVSLNLTAMTVKELEAVRELFNLALDLAEPVVQHRDEVARRAQDQGDDSFARSYRQLPELVIRKGKIATYDQGVLQRPADVPVRVRAVGQPADRRGDGAGGAGGGVADEESSDTGAPDDGAETHEP